MDFDSISPVDFRYLPEGRAKELLSERGKIVYLLKVEAALASALSMQGIFPAKIAEEILIACSKVTPEEVYAEEQSTKHDIRALVNCIRKRISDAAKPYVHLTATSEDIKQTAESMRIRDFTNQLLLPELLRLENTLIKLAIKHKGTLQIARTHGQHALPITFGFAMSEYVSRLGNRIIKIKRATEDLKGQLSGAVGAYNSASIVVNDPDKLELDTLKLLGLERSTHSTQILEPEYLVDYAHSVVSAFGVLANLADDLRHLQRTEIAEVAELFEEKQVGSSTMPHKRNPWHFENIKSLYKVFMPRMITLYLDQISEHQRDLSNSASSRFLVELLAGFLFAVTRMENHIASLTVLEHRMRQNLMSSADSIMAEPLYLMLAANHHPDAHEHIRRLTMKSQAEGIPLRKLAFADRALKPYLTKFSSKQLDIIQNPEKYIGLSIRKTEEVCDYWRRALKLKNA